MSEGLVPEAGEDPTARRIRHRVRELDLEIEKTQRSVREADEALARAKDACRWRREELTALGVERNLLTSWLNISA